MTWLPENLPRVGELLLMHLRGGRCGDTQVLEPESVELMHADRIGEAISGLADGSENVIGTMPPITSVSAGAAPR